MLKKCLDEGLLQAYLDGELAGAELARAETHLAGCGACAVALREAEGELSMLACAFAEEDALSVPSERLRERIEAAVGARDFVHVPAIETHEGTGWRGFFATLAASLSFATPRAAAFAGVTALFVCGTIWWIAQNNDTQAPAELAVSAPPPTEMKVSVNPVQSAVEGVTVQQQQSAPASSQNELVDSRTVRAAYRAERSGASRTSSAQGRRAVRSVAGSASGQPLVLSGEEKYLESIASLSRTAGAASSLALEPASRAEYERNLALVDEAIVASRRNALRQPKDEQAKRFLFDAYESKVELLSTVVSQGQIAGLGR